MRFGSHRSRLDPRKNLVGFLVGSVHYAIDILRVREIVNPLAITALPHMPASVVGVADHRGDVVPIIDLRLRMGAPTDNTRRTKWILINVGEHLVGMVVDAVTGVFGATDERLRPAPNVGGGEDDRRIVGVTTYGGSMVFVLDLAMIDETVGPLLPPGADRVPRGLPAR